MIEHRTYSRLKQLVVLDVDRGRVVRELGVRVVPAHQLCFPAIKTAGSTNSHRRNSSNRRFERKVTVSNGKKNGVSIRSTATLSTDINKDSIRSSGYNGDKTTMVENFRTVGWGVEIRLSRTTTVGDDLGAPDKLVPERQNTTPALPQKLNSHTDGGAMTRDTWKSAAEGLVSETGNVPCEINKSRQNCCATAKRNNSEGERERERQRSTPEGCALGWPGSRRRTTFGTWTPLSCPCPRSKVPGLPCMAQPSGYMRTTNIEPADVPRHKRGKLESVENGNRLPSEYEPA